MLQLEERETELERRREAGEVGIPDPDDEDSMNKRTEMFSGISEDSTTLFCAAYELCQAVLQRQQVCVSALLQCARAGVRQGYRIFGTTHCLIHYQCP